MSSVAGAGVPDPLARHLELALDPLAPPATHVECVGEGRVRRRLPRGLHVPVPVTWELDLAPGRAFRWDLHLRLLRRRVFHAFAEFRDGRGRFKAGRKPHGGPEADRSERILLWVWTLALAPEALLAAPSSAFEEGAGGGLTVRFAHDDPPHELRFGEDGLLREIVAERYNLEAGRPVPWRATLEDYRPYGGLRAPRRVTTAWDERRATRLTITKLVRTPHAVGDPPN